MAAGVAAIRDNGYYMDNCRRIEKSREYTAAELRRLGFEVLDSKANFVFAKSSLIGGEELYLALKSRGILVRHFGSEKIKEYNRITIGTPEDMKALVEAVSEILGGKK